MALGTHGQEQNRQPCKFAPNEARSHDEQPPHAVLLACGGERPKCKRSELTLPGLGSMLAGGQAMPWSSEAKT
jgi:cytochrome bd-type quinol oxidase subunit 1